MVIEICIILLAFGMGLLSIGQIISTHVMRMHLNEHRNNI